MVDCGICNQTQTCLTEPLPEYNILVHGGRLQLRLLAQVKYLKCPRLCLESDDLFVPVHNSTVGFDRSSDDIVIVLQIDNHDFGGCGSRLCFSDAYEGIGFESLDRMSADALQRGYGVGEILTHELNPIDAAWKKNVSEHGQRQEPSWMKSSSRCSGGGTYLNTSVGQLEQLRKLDGPAR